MKKLLLSLVVVLAGCGGGGGSDKPITQSALASPQATLLSQVASESYFIEKPNAFPDLTPIYNKLCGNSTQLTYLLPIDLNNDGRTDLLTIAFCDLNGKKINGYPYGSEYHGPMPTSLIALLQQSDGTFILGNQQVFGRDIIDIGGIGIPVIGDFNNDSKPDIVIGARLEDGRALVTMPDGSSSWDAPVAVVMAGTDNKYTLEFLPKGMNNSISVAKDTDGRDIFQASNAFWRYDNLRWTTMPPNNNVTGYEKFFKNNNSNYAVSISREDIGLSLQKQVGFDWTIVSNLSLGLVRKVDVYAPDFGANGYSKQYLVTIDNVDYLMPSVADMCLADINGKKFIYGIFFGNRMRVRYDGNLITLPSNVQSYSTVYREDEGQQIFIASIENEKINFLSMTKLSKQLTMFNDQGNGLSCPDMNNDSTKDIVFNRWGPDPTPYLFINNNATLTQVSSSNIPKASSDFTYGASSIMMDLNIDGKIDLIYYPSQGYDRASNVKGSGRFQLFLGSKLLN